ncbi:MAG TPA: SLC13 family permease [Planctomycetota bacterium]|nr:SLC13 family permease [Planctomycetota bacterium]
MVGPPGIGDFPGSGLPPGRTQILDRDGPAVQQSAKGLAVILVLVVLFLATSWPRDVLALAAGGLLLTSRRMHSREVLALVDWQLLVLFVGLFIVNRALADSGTTAGWGSPESPRETTVSRRAPPTGMSSIFTKESASSTVAAACRVKQLCGSPLRSAAETRASLGHADWRRGEPSAKLASAFSQTWMQR